MEELLIKIIKKGFDKLFLSSQYPPKSNKFERFEENGGFLNLGDHRVTGKEMNHFVDQIQNEFIYIEKELKDIYNEFREIHNAIDALDDDYCKGINGAMDSVGKAQSDIDDTVNNLIKTVEKLKNIEKKVERIEKMPTSSNYDKKIKIAYFVGGSAVALSIINFVLQLLGII